MRSTSFVHLFVVFDFWAIFSVSRTQSLFLAVLFPSLSCVNLFFSSFVTSLRWKFSLCSSVLSRVDRTKSDFFLLLPLFDERIRCLLFVSGSYFTLCLSLSSFLQLRHSIFFSVCRSLKLVAHARRAQFTGCNSHCAHAPLFTNCIFARRQQFIESFCPMMGMTTESKINFSCHVSVDVTTSSTTSSSASSHRP